MTEFTQGIFRFLKHQMMISSFARALVYTLGHILIAALCNIFITGAEVTLATADAIIEPIINGFWYYALDKVWSRNFYQTEGQHAKR